MRHRIDGARFHEVLRRASRDRPPLLREVLAQARWSPTVWASGCATTFVLCLANVHLAAKYDPEGNLVTGVRRALGLGVMGGFLCSMFLGPPLYFVVQRFFAPATIHDFGGASLLAAEWVEASFGSSSFASGLDDRG